MLVVMITISGSAFAQEIYKGKVTDQETGKPIPGVEIRFVGSKFEVQTAEDGTFSIERTGDTYTIRLNHPDYDIMTYNMRDADGMVYIEMHSNVRYNQYGQRVSRQVLTTESREGYISWESKDKNYHMWMDNRIYLDGAYYMDNYDNDLSYDENKERGQLKVPGQYITLRRMRFALKVDVGNKWYGEIDVDFAGNEIDVKDAYLRHYLGDWGQVRIGQFRMAQGMQQTTTSRYLKFIERANAYKFNPNRKLGIGYSSWSNHYMFKLGVFTEEVQNVDTKLYFKGAIHEVDPMQGVSTRLAWYPINEQGKLIHIGAGYTYNTPGLENRIKIDPKDETKVSQMEFLQAKVKDVKGYQNINFELAGSYGPFRASAEYYMASMTRSEANLETVKFSGFYVQGAWLLTGENHAWNYREAEFTQVRANSKKGAWEVAARFSNMNLNDFNAGVYGGEGDYYTAGLNYYASRNVKFMINYTFVDHDRYANDEGSLEWATKMDAPAGQGGYDYGYISWRCEIDF
jgi:phosphate-selective porin OprO/OprP